MIFPYRKSIFLIVRRSARWTEDLSILLLLREDVKDDNAPQVSEHNSPRGAWLEISIEWQNDDGEGKLPNDSPQNILSLMRVNRK